MGNYERVKTEIYHYICARTPFVIIDSSERERAERILREIAAEKSIEITYYTDTRQVRNILDDNMVLDVENDPLQHFASSFKKRQGGTFAFGDVKRISDDNSYSRELLNILYLAKENNNTLIVITPDHIWSRLSQFGMLTTLDRPDHEERMAQIGQFIQNYKSRYRIEWEAADIRKAATLLRGFSEIQVENILSTAIIAENGLPREKIYELTKQKSRLYSAISSIQMVQVDASLEVSGLGRLKQWLREKEKIFFASDEELASRDLHPPKGILLAGVPGCGKSFSAKMVAKEWELPLFRFDIGTVYDKWVGESEKKMKESLQFIDNVAPCIVWIDEIEKALSVSDSGNDTGKRVLGQFLFWLQESNSRVFLIATANEVDMLPLELFRKGRFSEVFFIDLPNEAERNMAIRQYSKKSLHIDHGREELEELVRISAGFSYSDIENAIKESAQMAILQGQQAITHDSITTMFRSVVPVSKSNPEVVSRIQKWGKECAVPASVPGGV